MSTVIQTRPSALKNAGILVDDVVVTAVENEPAFDVEFQTGNCAGNFPLLGVTETSGESFASAALEILFAHRTIPEATRETEGV